MLEPAVDGLGGAVGGAGVVEVGQDVLAPALQGSPEAGDLLDPGWHPGGDGVDQGAHEGSAVGLVGVLVGVDHLLVRAPGDLNDHVALVGEQAGQPGLLDLAAGPIEGVAGELDHVEGVHDRPGVRQLLSDGGLVPG